MSVTTGVRCLLRPMVKPMDAILALKLSPLFIGYNFLIGILCNNTNFPFSDDNLSDRERDIYIYIYILEVGID